MKHRIDMGDASPIRQPPRTLTHSKKEQAQEAVQDMNKQGVIQPSYSAWSPPVVLIKDGGILFCLDYRELNHIIIKDSYHLPRIDDSIEALVASVFLLLI